MENQTVVPAPKTPTGADRCERLPLTTPTKRRLWSESGGYCQRPECGIYLFEDDDVDFAEMAHVVAATTGGARDIPKVTLSEAERAHHTNVTVLCANCHTMVDKTPDRYPIATLRAWKARARAALEGIFGTPRFTSRDGARSHVEPLLAANATVFSTYGPRDDDFSVERADLWQHHARRIIVPNNARIARVLQVNRDLLTAAERGVADLFVLHEAEFSARHMLHDPSAGTSTFPDGMADILTP